MSYVGVHHCRARARPGAAVRDWIPRCAQAAGARRSLAARPCAQTASRYRRASSGRRPGPRATQPYWLRHRLPLNAGLPGRGGAGARAVVTRRPDGRSLRQVGGCLRARRPPTMGDANERVVLVSVRAAAGAKPRRYAQSSPYARCSSSSPRAATGGPTARRENAAPGKAHGHSRAVLCTAAACVAASLAGVRGVGPSSPPRSLTAYASVSSHAEQAV